MSVTCGQGLFGSPLVHKILRSPLLYPNVRMLPALMHEAVRENIHIYLLKFAPYF